MGGREDPGSSAEEVREKMRLFREVVRYSREQGGSRGPLLKRSSSESDAQEGHESEQGLGLGLDTTRRPSEMLDPEGIKALLKDGMTR